MTTLGKFEEWLHFRFSIFDRFVGSSEAGKAIFHKFKSYCMKRLEYFHTFIYFKWEVKLIRKAVESDGKSVQNMKQTCVNPFQINVTL